jgi:mRNA-degrading endonuclease RelE of RelBE toxin-antitoxin system
MVNVAFHPNFQKTFSKIKATSLKEKIIKQFIKIRDNPEAGKPMRYNRKGTREVYVPPCRLSYLYLKNENKIIFLDLYHRDKQ